MCHFTCSNIIGFLNYRVLSPLLPPLPKCSLGLVISGNSLTVKISISKAPFSDDKSLFPYLIFLNPCWSWLSIHYQLSLFDLVLFYSPAALFWLHLFLPNKENNGQIFEGHNFCYFRMPHPYGSAIPAWHILSSESLTDFCLCSYQVECCETILTEPVYQWPCN